MRINAFSTTGIKIKKEITGASCYTVKCVFCFGYECKAPKIFKCKDAKKVTDDFLS